MSEQEALYERRFKEGYDLLDPSYMAWLKITHPGAVVSDLSSETASLVSEAQTQKHSGSCQQSVASSKSIASSRCKSTTSAAGSCSSDVLSELLVLPEPRQ